MAKTEKVFITVDGDYDGTKAYRRLVCVKYEKAIWLSLKDVPAGNAPSENSEYWMLWVKDGINGDTVVAGNGIIITQAADGSKTVAQKGARVYVGEDAPDPDEYDVHIW